MLPRRSRKTRKTKMKHGDGSFVSLFEARNAKCYIKTKKCNSGTFPGCTFLLLLGCVAVVCHLRFSPQLNRCSCLLWLLFQSAIFKQMKKRIPQMRFFVIWGILFLQKRSLGNTNPNWARVRQRNRPHVSHPCLPMSHSCLRKK